MFEPLVCVHSQKPFERRAELVVRLLVWIIFQLRVFEGFRRGVDEVSGLWH